MKLLLIVGLTLTVPLYAHEGHEGGTEILTGQSGANGTQEPQKLIGVLELRPSTRTNKNEYFMENSLELGYRFSPRLQASYVQEFKANLSSADGESEHQANLLSLHEGYLRGNLSNLWINESGNTSLSYEMRWLLPTDTEHRQAGMLSAIRNYFTLSYRANDTVTLSLTEMPVLHFYRTAGALKSEHAHEHEHEAEHGRANPLFENRLYLTADFRLTPGVLLSVPARFHVTRYRNFQNEAKLNNAFGYYLWIAPEISFAVAPKTAIGAAYYSENLVTDNLSGLQVAKGISNGVFQLVLQTAI